MSTTSNDARTQAIKSAALNAGMRDLDLLAIPDLSRLTLGADGELAGADEFFASLKAAKPHWFGDTSSSSSAVPPGPRQRRANSVMDLSPAEYAAARKRVTGNGRL